MGGDLGQDRGWMFHQTEPGMCLSVRLAHLLQDMLQLIKVHEVLREDDQLLFALLTAVQDVLHCPCLCGCSLAQSSSLVCQVICHCQQLLHSLCSTQTAVRCQSQTYRMNLSLPAFYWLQVFPVSCTADVLGYSDLEVGVYPDCSTKSAC